MRRSAICWESVFSLTGHGYRDPERLKRARAVLQPHREEGDDNRTRQRPATARFERGASVQPIPPGRPGSLAWGLGNLITLTISQASAAVRIRISDEAHLGSLKSYLEATECSVRVVGEVTLDVSMPRAPSDAQALREVAIYLRTWQAMNPDVFADIEGEGDAEQE